MDGILCISIDPRDNSVFYAGKGCKRRMYNHVNEVKRGRIPNKSNIYLGRKIKKILSLGLKVKYKKVFITENEQEIISKIGLKDLCNLTEGGEGKFLERKMSFRYNKEKNI